MINKEKLENLASDLGKCSIELRGKFKTQDCPKIILSMIEGDREQKREEYNYIDMWDIVESNMYVKQGGTISLMGKTVVSHIVSMVA